MSAPSQSVLLRLAHASLRATLRVWPEESLPWGHALAAELHEIHQPWEALRWTLGGLMLFARSTVSNFLDWLKLPAGARLSGNSPAASNGPLLPRRPRLFTAAVLIATAIVFLLPQSQEAFSTIFASWRGYGTSSSDIRALERLGERAQKENDAHTLAFVALSLPHSDQATGFARRAVALDPSLFWIDAVRVDVRPGFARPLPADMDRILNADKGNAYLELLAARENFQPRYTALVHTHTPSDQEVDALASSDPAWLAHMDRAFAASRYESYVDRHWQLTREVWGREHSFSPSVVFYALWAHFLPDMGSIEAYSRIQYRKAHEALQAGHPDQAEALLKQVDSFARLMQVQAQTTVIEGFFGLSLSREATIELLHFYQNTNRPVDSARASQRIEEIAAILNSRHQAVFARARHSQDLETRGWLVDIVTFLAALAMLTAVLSLILVELRSDKSKTSKGFGRAFLCFAADWAPVSCLVACIALLWVFQPFAQILATAHTVMTASDAWFTLHHQGLFRLGSAFPIPYYDGLRITYHLWQAATYSLGALALFIAFRRFLFPRRA